MHLHGTDPGVTFHTNCIDLCLSASAPACFTVGVFIAVDRGLLSAGNKQPSRLNSINSKYLSFEYELVVIHSIPLQKQRKGHTGDTVSNQPPGGRVLAILDYSHLL